MNIYEIIEKKRCNKEISLEEINYFCLDLINENISREQAAALLMAICINGMSNEETSNLTKVMTNSGVTLNFKHLRKPIIDKHSTGGVGDKTSLILLPIMLALNIAVPMISGRGLGHTGGTIDKLESIEGYKSLLSIEEIYLQMEKVGGMIVSQTDEIAPADRIIYSIRDVTGTVNSPELITASILSKKLAEGLDALVLDLKIGNGAFFKTIEEVESFSRLMYEVSERNDLKMSIVHTDMNQPLGYNIGNWLEVVEAEEYLKGNASMDLNNIVFKLATEMLMRCGTATFYEANNLISQTISSGKALECFYKWLESQGGDIHSSRKKYLDTPFYIIKSKHSGRINRFDTKLMGFAAIELGAGRKKPNDLIDHSAGIKLLKKIGDTIDKDEAIAAVFGRNKKKFDKSELMIKQAIDIVVE